MNLKQVAGVVVLVIGVALIGYGVYTRSQISRTRNEIHKLSESKNSVTQSVGKNIERQIGDHHRKTMVYIVSGGIFVIFGAGVTYMSRKRRR